MLCVAAGAAVLSLAATEFTLDWTHSVARITWWERWSVSPEGLAPVEARMSGAGAGMEPPADAIWQSDGWHFRPNVPPQKQVMLAASGETVGGWRLCVGGECHMFDQPGEPLRLWTAPACSG